MVTVGARNMVGRCSAMRGPSAESWFPQPRTTRSRIPRKATYVCRLCRGIQISTAPSTDPSRVGGDAFGASPGTERDFSDARFEVLGSPYSLLSVTLAASQKLYTRRGTLIAVAGHANHARSTLSVLNPLLRAPLGVPFLYQRISATSPVTALISTKSLTTTFTVLHLDGTTDWMVSQRNALLAWTGHRLSLSSRVQRSLSLAHWGSTLVTGRGLAALSAPGQIYQLTLAEGEKFAARPGAVVAYTVTRNAPQPFRFGSSKPLQLQVPSPTAWLAETKWVKSVLKSSTYRLLTRTLWSLRTIARRSIWGEAQFLNFRGPMTLLMSSRGVRVADVLSQKQVDEIADAPPGAVASALTPQAGGSEEKGVATTMATMKQAPSALHVAAVGHDGKVTFEEAQELKEFVR